MYVQWGRKTCTAPSGVAVRKFYDGFAWGTRHNLAGGGGNIQCLKNEGRARQGSSPNDASDLIVPLRKEYSQYTGVSAHAARNGYIIPCSKCERKRPRAHAPGSAPRLCAPRSPLFPRASVELVPCGRNHRRSRQHHPPLTRATATVAILAACLLTDQRSCYLESGTTACASGWLPFYAGFFYGGYQGHHGNNNRICVDKDVTAGEYTTNVGTSGHLYPTVERSAVGARSRSPSAVRCMQCCKR